MGAVSGAELAGLLEAATARARASGALEPIETRSTVVEDEGVRFVVRVVEGLRRKAAASVGGAAGFNPFLPYDPAMFVGEVSGTHVGLLNKFPVLPVHLLLVTRAFESQAAPLGRADLEALAVGLQAVDGLGFYNGGEVAGASQGHKHLQVVGLPLAEGEVGVPMEVVFGGEAKGLVREAPFRHGRVLLGEVDWSDAVGAGAAMLAAVERLRSVLWWGGEVGAYNLLATRRWVAMVPRSRERFEGISVNALGFAGALLVKREEDVERVRRCGPMTALRGLAS